MIENNLNENQNIDEISQLKEKILVHIFNCGN